MIILWFLFQVSRIWKVWNWVLIRGEKTINRNMLRRFPYRCIWISTRLMHISSTSFEIKQDWYKGWCNFPLKFCLSISCFVQGSSTLSHLLLWIWSYIHFSITVFWLQNINELKTFQHYQHINKFSEIYVFWKYL